MHQANNVPFSALREITGMHRQCVSMGVKILQFCLFAISCLNTRIDALNQALTRQPQYIPKHHSPLMTCCILPSDEAVNSFGDVTLIQTRLSVSHSLAFDAQVSFLIPELMQETKDNVNPAKHLGIIIT